MENVQKNITLVAHDLATLTPRGRTAKMKAGKTPYIDALMRERGWFDFVEYLCGTLDELHNACQNQRRQLRFQRAKRERCPKPYTHCRMCGGRLMRERDGKLVATETKDFERAFCRGPKCRKELIKTKPVLRVVKIKGVPQPSVGSPLPRTVKPLDHVIIPDQQPLDRVPNTRAIITKHAKQVRKVTDRLPHTIRDVFKMLPGKVSKEPSKPLIPPVQRELVESSKIAWDFSYKPE